MVMSTVTGVTVPRLIEVLALSTLLVERLYELEAVVPEGVVSALEETCERVSEELARARD